MAVKDGYAKARATKKNSKSVSTKKLDGNNKKKIVKSVKKSPILLIVLLMLALGIAGGFFSWGYLSPFKMQGYLVNGVASEEVDYVVVDISEIKENILKDDPTKTMDEIYESIILEDGGVVCKFFGIDVSDTVSVRYLYREDISHDTQDVDKIDISTAGVYYIEYTSSHFAFKNTTLIRTIVVMEVENDG